MPGMSGSRLDLEPFTVSQDEIKEMTKNDRPSTEKLARKVRMFLSRRPLREILHLKPQHSAAVILVVLAVFWGALEIRSRITHVYESVSYTHLRAHET